MSRFPVLFLFFKQTSKYYLFFGFCKLVATWAFSIIVLFLRFSLQRLTGGLSLNSEGHQFSSGLQDSSQHLSNAVIWMVSILPLSFNYSSLFSKPLGVVPSSPNTIGTTNTFMYHSLLSSLARSNYLSVFSLSLIFILWSAGTAKSTIRQVLIFFLFSFLYLC